MLHRLACLCLWLLVAVCALRGCGGVRTAAMGAMAAVFLLFVIRSLSLLCRKGAGGGWRLVERIPDLSVAGYLLLGASVLYGQDEPSGAGVCLALAVVSAAGLLIAGRKGRRTDGPADGR